MKALLNRLSLLTLLCLVLRPVVGHASPSESDSVHYCVPFDYEQWRQDHPRSAAKRAADLNVGEPRTVRMIYFLPNDRPYRQDVVNSMKTAIVESRTFFSEQMQAHALGKKTFSFESDGAGTPVVHRMDGQHPDSAYVDDTMDAVLQEIGTAFDVEQNVYLIVIDISTNLLGYKAVDLTALGLALWIPKNGGIALVPGLFRFRTVTHELGHAFGLPHDFRDRKYIMSYGGIENSQLSDCNAGFLAVHPYFDPAVPFEEASPPSVEIVSSLEYRAGSETVPVQLKLSSPEGLHHLLMLAEERGGLALEVWKCRNLAGKQKVEVAFDYDGFSPSHADWDWIRRLSDQDKYLMSIRIADSAGNALSKPFELSEEEDAAERPRASTIVIISGNNQEGTPGSELTKPLVVEVLDQHGQPLPDETIQFGVTEGEGRLSARHMVENVATDASGRAELTLFLGPYSGTIIVRVSAPQVPKCQPVFFTAFGSGASTVSSGHGDTNKWHLPYGVIGRLGNGRLGRWDRALSYSPDGRLLAVASAIGAWLYDVGTSRALSLFPASDPVEALAFSRDGTLLATGASGGTITLWEVATGTAMSRLTAHPYLSSVAFSSDGTLLASGSMLQVLELWDLANQTAVLTFEASRTGNLIDPVSVAFSPDGGLLAAGFQDRTVRLWDVETRKNVLTLHGHRLRMTSVAFAPNRTALASGSLDGDIRLWDTSTGRNTFTINAHSRGITTIAFARDGLTLASGSRGSTAKLWDVATGKLVTALTGGHMGGISSLSLSPDGSILATGSSNDGTLAMWDVGTGNATTLNGSGHIDVGGSVAFSQDGSVVATGSTDGTVKLWDARTGRHTRSLGLQPVRIYAVAFSPDGRTLAAGSGENIIELWDFATGAKLASFSRQRGQVLSLAFSPDGRILAAGDPQGLALWDVASVTAASAALGPTASSPVGLVSKDRATDHYISPPLRQEDSWVWSLAFSPDGKTVASGTDNLIVRLWDASTLEEITTIRPTEGTRV